MNKAGFDQAKLFILSDIEREIQLVRGQHLLRKRTARKIWGVRPGGGNFLAALGLLCYTEFAGRLKLNDFSDYNSGKCFEEFFADLGPAYAALLPRCPIYKDLRCGLAHQYYVKKACTIAALEVGHQDGVGMGIDICSLWRHTTATFRRLQYARGTTVWTVKFKPISFDNSPAAVRLPINQIRVGHRVRKGLGDLKGLAQSIEAMGLLHPIVVATGGKLIAGERRLKACRMLGWDKVPVT